MDALVLRGRDSDGDGTLDERLYVAQDANYNVTALLDNAGTVVERYVYDPFGSVTVLDADWTEHPSNPPSNWTERSGGSQSAWVYLHQGGRFDDVSGLYHFRYREYSPTLGRWTSLDSLGYDAGDVNLYRGVKNNPVSRLDPTGLLPPDPPFPINQTEWEAVKAFEDWRKTREAEVTGRMRQRLAEHTKNWNDAEKQKAFSELDRLLHCPKHTLLSGNNR